MSKASPEGSLGPRPKLFWRGSGLLLPAEGPFPQVSVHSPKSQGLLRPGQLFQPRAAQSSQRLLLTARSVPWCSFCVSQLAGNRGKEKAGRPRKGSSSSCALHLQRGAVPAVSCPWHTACQTHIPGTGTGLPGQRWDGHGKRAARGPWARGCSEQAPANASAPTDPTDTPKMPQGTAGTGECQHGLFAEGLRQQFPVLTSHTPASYVPATQNAFPSSLRPSSLSSVKAKASFPHSNEMPSNALRDAFK